MAEPSRQQMGDGADDYGQAAGQTAKAARQAGQETAKQAAAKGTEAAANAAAATVKASVEGGKAAAEIATGTAVGGPWGAILAAAWSLWHTLFKILVCICLSLLLLITMIVSLPAIVTNSIFGLDGTKPEDGATLSAAYSEMAAAVTSAVNSGRDQSLAKVEQIIEEGGYDYELSMEALMNHAQSSAGFDTSYILAAYSASMQQKGTGKNDMAAKMNQVAGEMFPVTYEEKEEEVVIPATYATYKPVTITVVTAQVETGIIDGEPQYRYETEPQTYYLEEESHTTDTEITVDAYTSVEVEVPVYSFGSVSGTRTETYYQANGTETVSPEIEVIKYVECTIHPFDNTVIAKAFGIDLDAEYDQFHVTYREAIQHMADALKMTLYGSLGGGQAVPLTDAELIAFVNRQDCNDTRKYILTTALSLVGKVPYFWGGKSGPGWNDEWNTPKLVTAVGSSSTGTIRPYGLDCSGFSTWVYSTALGSYIGAGTSGQYGNTVAISAAELLPGDLGFLAESGGDGWNHVLIFAGYGESGERMWVHSSSGSGVVLNTPSYDSAIMLRRPMNVDFEAAVAENGGHGEALYTIEVEVTHYCACTKCCGSNASGITASGKAVSSGMVAMSSNYPFGTQIMINGVMYTVEDRGGSSIENNIHRVDIYVPDHNQALRMGRYTTTATIYRIGR